MQGNASTSPSARRRQAHASSPGFSAAASPPRWRRSSTRSRAFSIRRRLPRLPSTKWTPGKVQDLKPNSGKIVKFGNKPALLVRVNDTEWKAFSAVCTHLNCTVQYQDIAPRNLVRLPQRHLRPEGRVVSGPPPKPLEELAVKIRGDEVVISKRV